MGRVKTHILGMGMSMGNYPQNWAGMGAGTGTHPIYPYNIYLFFLIILLYIIIFIKYNIIILLHILNKKMFIYNIM
jgi:hypothetical protein